MDLRSAAVALIAVGSIAVAACGGSSEQDKIKRTVTTYLHALADGDGEKACDQLTGDQQRAVGEAGAQAGIGGGSCPGVVRTIAEKLDDGQKSTLRDATVEKVTITGDAAKATIDGAPNVPELTKSGGDWLISGGLSEFLGGEGGSNTADSTIRKKIDTAEKQVQANPENEAALAEVIRGHYQLATAGADPNTGQFTSVARPDLERAATAWQSYLATNPQKPRIDLARVMVQAYSGLGQIATQGYPPTGALEAWAGAAGAAELIAAAQPTSSNYIALVQFASLAGQARKADLAGMKAIELAPHNQKKAVKQQVASAKVVAASQVGGPAP
jgi:hypothetical protein